MLFYYLTPSPTYASVCSGYWSFLNTVEVCVTKPAQKSCKIQFFLKKKTKQRH